MNHMLAVAATIFALSIAQPASAADLATIDCITNGLDASMRQTLAADAKKLVRGEANGDFDDATKVKFKALSHKCQAQFGWSEKARSASEVYNISGSYISEYEAALRDDGLDVAKVETVIRNLPPAQFAALSREPMPESAARAVLSALASANITVETRTKASHVGALGAVMSVMESSKAEFATS